MSRAMLRLAALAAFLLASAGLPVVAAELDVSPRVAHAHGRVLPHCGPCGCLRVSYVYHRQLRSTYGLSYDPRNYDQTEPHYYLGPVRAYPRYFVEGWANPGSC